MFEVIQRNLKGSNESIKNDKSIFEDWVEQRITFEECRSRFFKNNRVGLRDQLEITDNLFLLWLKSLGW